jgi:TRAP-type C4-dicarboxylate transport system permease small subunit
VRVKRFVLASVASVLVLAFTFALIFGGGLLWEVHGAPHDGQAGIGPFFAAIFVSPVVALLTFISVLRWDRVRESVAEDASVATQRKKRDPGSSPG